MKTITLDNKNYNIGKIVCVGRNYAEHAKELGNEIPEFPLIFLKPSSSLIFSEQNIIHPSYGNELHHEVELVLLIGKTIKDADIIEAEKSVVGYTVGLDMTLRDTQNLLKAKGHPWTLAKCFDTSAVISNFVSVKDYKLTLNETIKLSVNNIEKQNSKLNMMLFKPAEIISYISKTMTLEEGDLIFTGTPSGVNRVVKGDNIKASIENLTELTTEIV
ncbi:MAG TPA: fumarylacetoacetate hydrolase family protein [Melioribacteraceae bacterium]|nr:fumarylacetoacetate hydrolase family protein [Melioribacteraceae bacterium]